MRPEVEKPLGWRRWLDTAVFYGTTAAVVFLGVCLGHFHLVTSRCQDHFHTPHRTGLAAAFANWDGQWYARIARDGCFDDPNTASSVGFFPAFPLLGRFLVWTMGLDYDLADSLFEYWPRRMHARPGPLCDGSVPCLPSAGTPVDLVASAFRGDTPGPVRFPPGNIRGPVRGLVSVHLKRTRSARTCLTFPRP